INMPEMGGVELYKSVRRNSRWITVPFIFLTSNSTPEEIQIGRELGVEDYLIKPIDPEELITVINGRLTRTAEVEVAHIGQAYLETVSVLANAIEGRDPYTRGHVERVTKYARWLAEELNWPQDQLRMLDFGGRLHDIGKIIVPDHVLKKPGRLSSDEWALMRQHPIAGAKILSEINHLKEALPYVLYHHERWDGKGYPHGLRQHEIPIEARVLAIADVYDALTTDRPYHPARPLNEVIKFFELETGKHFDPYLIPIFIRAIHTKS
ncbi:MAG: HD domain-containing protein, partial [Aliifodinibius sp.]|nr:HD domain-containing protein [candidate division Zixibacteria bacterium]NIT60408.1 HD domain-containing protein [Fodinibius sp.]NIS48156.1 HD domain-containing protein [candidate division Zixibacteria bacterium]NIU16272.1 HD domain-containing protein [candidate division Zixibacteria bacterium]NIV15147.1 HD domain-containing protein [Fodinibius sp.]